MSKKFSSLIVATVSSLLLNSASFAGRDCHLCHEDDPTGSKGKAAAFHYTVSKPNSDEAKWWNDFETSKERDITRYVEDLASKDAKAASWFLLTGGKNGFSSKKATDEETALLLSAIKKVAIAFGNATDKTQGLQEWAKVKASVEAGHLHLQMLYKEVNQLKFEVSSLKTELAETNRRLAASEIKQQELADQLEQERKSRKEELEQERKSRKEELEQERKSRKEELEQERKSRKEELENLMKFFEAKHTDDIATIQDSFNKTLAASNRSAKDRYTQNASPQSQQHYLNTIEELTQNKSKTKGKLKKARQDKDDLLKQLREDRKEERKEEKKDRDKFFEQFNDERSVLKEAINAIKLMLEKK